MKKLVKFSLATLAIATLAACSSGGGGSGSSSTDVPAKPSKPATQTPVTPTNPSKPTNLSKPTPEKPSKPVDTTSSKVSYGDTFYNGRPFEIQDASKHPQKLLIANMEFPLEFPGIYSRFTEIGSAGRKTAVNGAYSPLSTRFGYLDFGDRSAVFYQGNNPTKEELKGQATYVGDAIYVRGNLVETESDDVRLYVDFDKKTISGTVFEAEDDIPAVTIKDAVITGNSFAGKVSHAGQEGDLKGKFFGTNAAEVAGAYSNGQGKAGWQGAFGAKKQ